MRESGAATEVISYGHHGLEAALAEPAAGGGMLAVPFRFCDRPDVEAWARTLLEAARRWPVVAVRCPDPGEPAGESAHDAQLTTLLAHEPRIEFVAADDVVARYAGPAYDGEVPHGEIVAGVATAIARRVHVARSPRRRVLAVYCDGLLWDGICAETDPGALLVGERDRTVQSFARDLRERGWQLWLVGRGDEADARRAFRLRPDMPLTWTDFSRVRINWDASTDNLAALVAEAGVPADEVVFLTDRPWVAALARERCPGVLALDLPGARRASQFLENAWAFDASPLAGVPARMSEVSGGRGAVRHGEGAELHVASRAELGEIARLSREVHHFNATASRVDIAELEWFARQPGREVLAVRSARDGRLVGALRTRRLGDAIRIVDWWLRAGDLGRSLESESLRAVGRRAVAAGVDAVEVAHVPQRSNEPVRRFLDRLGAERRRGEYVVPIAAALSGAVEERAAPGRAHGEAAFIARAAGYLGEPRRLLREVERRGFSVPPSKEPQSESEKWLASLWSELLGVGSVNLDDDFFSLGGDSLTGTRLLARINATLGLELTLAGLFDSPTLEAQASRLSAGPEPGFRGETMGADVA